MNNSKILDQLHQQYPGKAIFKYHETVPSEILCEVEPTSEHRSYSRAMVVIDKSIPHVHKKTTETYKILKGKLKLFVDKKLYDLSRGETIVIHPNQPHWAEGEETWVECYSEPGWAFVDHIQIRDGSSIFMKAPTQSWLSPFIEMKKSSVQGKGMFALTTITQGEAVMVWGGSYVDQVAADVGKKAGKLVMQWDENLYTVDDRGANDDYFLNHSCDSNLWMIDAFTLVARRDI